MLTANHCGKDADLSTAIFYFNYQRPDCNTGYGTTRYTTVGATKIANRLIYDMFLMELNEKPPEDYDVHFAGWNREDYQHLHFSVFGIHHPHGWEKKLSEGELVENINPDFWRVRYYEYPTEEGSSGSPVFDNMYRGIIGWASYSYSSCNNQDGVTTYGKLRKAWDGPNSDDRLHDWLDPNNYNNIQIFGRDPCFENVTIQNRELRSAQYYYQPWDDVIIQASNELNTSGTVIIFNGANFEFRAGSNIILTPGFRVQAGARFNATISPCDPKKYTYNKKVFIGSVENILVDIEPQLEKEISPVEIFPNPFEDELNINFNLENGEFVIITIRDIQGKMIEYLIKERNFDNNIFTKQFNLSHLSNGLYIISIYTDTFQKNIKVIKNK